MQLQRDHIKALETAERLMVCCDYCPYLELKTLLKDRSATGRRKFQTLFTSYYGLTTGGLTDRFKKQYFEILFEGSKSGPDAAAILAALCRYKLKTGKRGMPFSFVSKLVGIHSDTSPIIDRHVLKFFGKKLPSSSATSRSKRIEKYLEIVEDIKADYGDWAGDTRVIPILKRLKQRDRRLKQCSDARLLDFLVWKVGNQKLL